MIKNLADVTSEDINNDLKANQVEINTVEAILREKQNVLQDLVQKKFMLSGALEILKAQEKNGSDSDTR